MEVKKSMLIEDGNIWVIDHLLVVHLASAPHYKLAVQAPLAMHDMKKPMWMLTLNRNNQRGLVNIHIRLVCQ